MTLNCNLALLDHRIFEYLVFGLAIFEHADTIALRDYQGWDARKVQSQVGRGVNGKQIGRGIEEYCQARYHQ